MLHSKFFTTPRWTQVSYPSWGNTPLQLAGLPRQSCFGSSLWSSNEDTGPLIFLCLEKNCGFLGVLWLSVMILPGCFLCQPVCAHSGAVITYPGSLGSKGAIGWKGGQGWWCLHVEFHSLEIPHFQLSEQQGSAGDQWRGRTVAFFCFIAPFLLHLNTSNVGPLMFNTKWHGKGVLFLEAHH